jgi:hypothetical protein
MEVEKKNRTITAGTSKKNVGRVKNVEDAELKDWRHLIMKSFVLRIFYFSLKGFVFYGGATVPLGPRPSRR